MIKWENIQKKYIEPISSKDLNIDLNIVNESFSSIFDKKNGIIEGFQLEKASNKQIKVNKGIFICDNVIIHFLEDIIIDINDIFYEKNKRKEVINNSGLYTLIIRYKYSRKLYNQTYAKIIIIKNEDNYELNKNFEFSIGNFSVDNNLNIIEILNENEENNLLNRQNISILSSLLDKNILESLQKPEIVEVITDIVENMSFDGGIV